MLLPDGQVVAPHRPTDTSGFVVGPMRSGKTDMAALTAAMTARSSSARPL
ncbi:hypothetical protein ACFYM7_34980 [Streptomyces cyaneofuscatus]